MPSPLRIAKDIAKRVLPKPVVDYLRKPPNRFEVMRYETDGMLSPAVYERLCEEVSRLPAGDIVEVGGAAGSATIAMAWGLQRADNGSHIVVIEKCERGSRARYGDYATNLARLEAHLESHGVRDRVVLFPKSLTVENGEEVLALVRTPELAALCCDADGRLHRDFRLFWPRLRPGGLIVVDDYDETRSRKHAVTWHLLNQLMEWGLFEPVELLNGTYFGRKPAGADFEAFDYALCDELCEGVRAEWDSDYDQKPLERP